MAKMWKLEDGLDLVRAVQIPSRRYGYHVTLGGSVLNKGESEKDLDLYFLPMGDGKVSENPIGLIEWLSGLWGQPEQIGKDYPDAFQPNVKYPPSMKMVDERDPSRMMYWVNEPLAMAGPAEQKWGSDAVFKVSSRSSPEAKPKYIYKHKLKFTRPSDHDRIDVFII